MGEMISRTPRKLLAVDYIGPRTLLEIDMSSLEALWTLRFGAMGVAEARLDGGVAIFETNRVFGGDSGFAYVGNYGVKDGTVSGNLTVIHHNPAITNIFGTGEESFEATFSGERMGDDEIRGQLTRPGFPPAQLVLRRLVALP